jgi:hypothetical protein
MNTEVGSNNLELNYFASIIFSNSSSPVSSESLNNLKFYSISFSTKSSVKLFYKASKNLMLLASPSSIRIISNLENLSFFIFYTN